MRGPLLGRRRARRVAAARHPQYAAQFPVRADDVALRVVGDADPNGDDIEKRLQFGNAVLQLDAGLLQCSLGVLVLRHVVDENEESVLARLQFGVWHVRHVEIRRAAIGVTRRALERHRLAAEYALHERLHLCEHARAEHLAHRARDVVAVGDAEPLPEWFVREHVPQLVVDVRDERRQRVGNELQHVALPSDGRRRHQLVAHIADDAERRHPGSQPVRQDADLDRYLVAVAVTRPQLQVDAQRPLPRRPGRRLRAPARAPRGSAAGSARRSLRRSARRARTRRASALARSRR